MKKLPSMPSLHNDIFVLRNKVVRDSNMAKKIFEINKRNIPIQGASTLEEHGKILSMIGNAKVQSHKQKNFSVDVSNKRLLNKIIDINQRQTTPPVKDYRQSLIFGSEILKKKQIDIENKKFLKKLVRVSSPLNKERLDKDFEKHNKRLRRWV